VITGPDATPGAIEENSSNVNEPAMSPSPSPMHDVTYATASFEYSGGYRPDELTFKKDTILAVIHDPNDGWLFGYVQGHETNQGWFPANYVTK